MIPVFLNPTEQVRAEKVGRDRWNSVVKKHRKARFPGATEDNQLVGARGELAFCKMLGVEWPETVDTFTEVPDVPPNWEVRTSPRMKGIKVVNTDPADRLVVWVRGETNRFEIMGFIRAGGAKKHPEWITDTNNAGRPFWKVPESRMIPINPGFHDSCSWEVDDFGGRCAFCLRVS